MDVPRPAPVDFEACWVLLDEAFEPVSPAMQREIESMIREDDWTVGQFLQAYRRILRTKTFIVAGDRRPRWSPGDWFRQPTPRVYPHSWYVALEPAARKQVAAYRAPGIDRPVFGYRHEIGTQLEEWVVTAPTEQRALPEPREPMPAALREEVDWMRRALAAEARLEDAERTIERQRRRIEEMGRWIEATPIAEDVTNQEPSDTGV